MASAVAVTLRKATTASTLFNKFIRLKPPFKATSTFSNRSFCSSTSKSGTRTSDSDQEISKKTSGNNDPPLVVKGSPQKFKMENPFQLGGPKDVVAVDELKDGILVRVTLPGVDQDGCKVWVENNTVFFAGKGEIEYENEDCGRTYGGSLEFDPEFSKVEDVKSEMKNGILRMIIPNVGLLEGEGKDQKK